MSTNTRESLGSEGRRMKTKRIEAGPDAVEVKPSAIPGAVIIYVKSQDGGVTLRGDEAEAVIEAMREAMAASAHTHGTKKETT